MEVTTASTAGSATGSTTIADLIPRAVADHGQSTAIRYKRDGAWQDVSYEQLADIVQEIGLGLIDLGVQAGDRLCILANTRARSGPTRTWARPPPARSSCRSTRPTRPRSACG